ncbi:uncharacterized protein LOC130880998 [Chionomys nivalis]|uniref:uncharacterized protein LOC130880998 n=1 Tax=Chionomys nivalis TaxID=269649 RepID=UPI0025993A47|nr:uncharacterized protein LOC130880998 [Chionomys nivalis]
MGKREAQQQRGALSPEKSNWSSGLGQGLPFQGTRAPTRMKSCCTGQRRKWGVERNLEEFGWTRVLATPALDLRPEPSASLSSNLITAIFNASEVLLNKGHRDAKSLYYINRSWEGRPRLNSSSPWASGGEPWTRVRSWGEGALPVPGRVAQPAAGWRQGEPGSSRRVTKAPPPARLCLIDTQPPGSSGAEIAPRTPRLSEVVHCLQLAAGLRSELSCSRLVLEKRNEY